MNLFYRLLFLVAFLLLIGFSPTQADEPPVASDARLEYLKVVNRLQPTTDPELVLLLMTQFISANDLRGGIAYYEDLLRRYEHSATPAQRSLYLSALGLLRAQHAKDLFVLRRIGWVRDTIAVLDEAMRLSGGKIFVVRWIRGNVFAQLPALFGKRETAFDDLSWCEANPSAAPHLGWMREVYSSLHAYSATLSTMTRKPRPTSSAVATRAWTRPRYSPRLSPTTSRPDTRSRPRVFATSCPGAYSPCRVSSSPNTTSCLERWLAANRH
jgi:hypothetical protein